MIELFLCFAGINWQIKASASQRDFSHAIANQLILRGLDLDNADLGAFTEPYLYPSWLPQGAGFQAWRHPRRMGNYEQTAILLNNGQMPVGVLDRTVEKAWRMFSSRAYVHQYLKHGQIEEDFVDSFAGLEQMIANYKRL